MVSAWTEHVAQWKNCTACGLCKQRDQICLARGDIPCDILMIGEAPGASEDAIGQTFVGPAGKLLDNDDPSRPGIVQGAGLREMGLRLLFSNLVACFPREAKMTDRHEPEHGEIIACRPRLDELIRIAQPQLIVCVGSLASEYVDHDAGVRCIDIVHPAAILGHMPVAQKQFAIQKCVAQLMNAARSWVGKDKPKFTQWESNHAGSTSSRITSPAGLRAGYSEADIPY